MYRATRDNLTCAFIEFFIFSYTDHEFSQAGSLDVAEYKTGELGVMIVCLKQCFAK